MDAWALQRDFKSLDIDDHLYSQQKGDLSDKNLRATQLKVQHGANSTLGPK